ncbi:cation:proton antiporter [Synechococcus sp. HJ21-Hayes]|uniref:cation:proton antiporter domain-containing protein n=1 Tax=unclassified Synechococcus TaxID=2626047 RepID=UPI0020CE56C3|nr:MULTISPECIES: cation:proton antiporter [unclassified Synechococcus]MCP9832394.1 cation:proton antiporter [Synechococcus sp. JJ3a-Johnson]MCP9853951.1 cation:proton antiporter [Synechococcus sp. HJ21-Hayes]
MSPSLALLLVMFGGLLLLAMFLDDLAAEIKVPGILLVLVLGLLIDNDLSPGAGGSVPLLSFAAAEQLAQLSLALVLFFGGLTANWTQMKPVLGPSLRLAVLGSLLTAGCLSLVVMGFQSLPATAVDVNVPVALFVGAMFCSTDASAVLSLLRPLQGRLPKPLLDLLECESGLNDPIAVVLAGLALAIAGGGEAQVELLMVAVVREFLLGAFLGWLGGKAAAGLLSRRQAAAYGGLAIVLSMALLMLIVGGSALVGASGLLAAYVMGVVLGNSPEVNRAALEESHSGFAKLAELTLFLCLGLVVMPSDVALSFKYALVLFVAVLLVRWLVVQLLLVRSGFRRRERTFTAMAGLRGAVPIAIAIQAASSSVPWGRDMPPFALAVVLLGLVLQGFALVPLARRLGLVRAPEPELSS